MKTRFLEILKENCDKYNVKLDNVLRGIRKEPIPAVKSFTVSEYTREYPGTTQVTIAGWLNMRDHSVVGRLRSKEDQYRNQFPPEVMDCRSFMSFGYKKKKIRFKYTLT